MQVDMVYQRIWDAIPLSGTTAQSLYTNLRGVPTGTVDTAIMQMMRKGAIAKAFNNFMRAPGAKWPMAESSEAVAKPAASAAKPTKGADPGPIASVGMPQGQEVARSKAILRDTSGLREVLFRTIEDLTAGKIDVASANAISKAADTILKTVDVQISFERLRLDAKRDINLNALPLVRAEGAA